jgi:hypothetical protein
MAFGIARHLPESNWLEFMEIVGGGFAAERDYRRLAVTLIATGVAD